MEYKNLNTRTLRTLGVCHEGIRWVENCGKVKPISVLRKLRDHRFDWANRLIVRLMSKEQLVRYAVYSAKQVLKIFEEKYPDDKRPREAINAAVKCLKNPSNENKSAAWSARSEAWAAVKSAERSAAERSAASWSARAAAWTAQSAARAAAWAAESAEELAWSAQSAIWSAQSAAESAAESAEELAMQKKIINYGIKLLIEKG